MVYRNRILTWTLLGLLISGCNRCFIKPDERVLFYSSYAYPTPDQKSWMVDVQGQVVREDPHSIFSDASLRALNSLAILVPDLGSRMVALEEKMRPFAVQGRPDIKVPLEAKGVSKKLAPSLPDGYFKDQISFPMGPETTRASWMDYQTEACHNDSRAFTGRALLIPDQGISVVSDLQGTLRAAETQNSANTFSFLSQSQPVPGMAERLQGWAANGAVIHYVSGDPWQWSNSLETYLKSHGYPEGVLHLNHLSWEQAAGSVQAALETLSSLLQPSTAHTAPVLEELLQRFPHRQFVLLGNSGVADGAVYAGLARRYPRQIQRIYIRQIPNSTPDSSWNEIFQGLPASQWKVFKSPDELPQNLVF
jgi:phosphatidate phosphatase APP1